MLGLREASPRVGRLDGAAGSSRSLDGHLRGWIDLVAFDPRTRTLLVIEIKTSARRHRPTRTAGMAGTRVPSRLQFRRPGSRSASHQGPRLADDESGPGGRAPSRAWSRRSRSGPCRCATWSRAADGGSLRAGRSAKPSPYRIADASRWPPHAADSDRAERPEPRRPWRMRAARDPVAPVDTVGARGQTEDERAPPRVRLAAVAI